jgi:hypothetical protein
MIDDYFKVGHLRGLIDDFRQSLSRKGFGHLLRICIQGFKTYLLAVTLQALLFYVRVQSKAASNSWAKDRSTKEQLF